MRGVESLDEDAGGGEFPDEAAHLGKDVARRIGQSPGAGGDQGAGRKHAKRCRNDECCSHSLPPRWVFMGNGAIRVVNGAIRVVNGAIRVPEGKREASSKS